MRRFEPAAILEVAPKQHARRCTLARSAIDSQRWPAAACNLRVAASVAQEWAGSARALADWCDAQAESGRVISAASNLEDQAKVLEPQKQQTLESIEAGLIALAHGLGREHAARTRRAMNGALQIAGAKA